MKAALPAGAAPPAPRLTLTEGVALGAPPWLRSDADPMHPRSSGGRRLEMAMRNENGLRQRACASRW